ncbi:MAG: MFS transporter [Opitutales bacterium]
MDNLAQKTFRLDLMRAPFHGFVQEGLVNLALIIAIRHFDGSHVTKSIMAAAVPLGLLLNPMTLSWGAKTGYKVGALGWGWMGVGAASMALAALSPSLLTFTICIVIAGICHAQMSPLITQVYTHNYDKSERGKRLSGSSLAAAAGAGVLTLISGKILDAQLQYYPWVLCALMIAFFMAGFVFFKIPVQGFDSKSVGNPWVNLKWVWRDKVFGLMLFAWMFMGIGNLMTLPLRTEYLANPEYGINAANATIATIIVVIPSIFRFISIPIWGWVFDKLNLIVVRITINVFFFISILGFFYTDNLLWIGIASAANGIAIGGGHITWALWVTKLAPPERVSGYMSIHSAFTGVRGVLAPFLGFYLLSATTPKDAGVSGAILVLIASAMFATLLKHPRFQD